VLESSDAVDADVGMTGIAAADVVARLLGRPGERSTYAETVDKWVAAHPLTPSPTLVQKALATLDRVTLATSELYELWEESGELDEWLSAVDAVRARILESSAD
jgi:hypothetical protein